MTSFNSPMSTVGADYSQSQFPYRGLQFNDTFKTTLQPHQCQSVEWMIHRENNVHQGIRGCLNFSEMGTGKTLCALSVVVLNSGPDEKTLVICPAGLVGVWKSEIQKHFTDDLTFFAYYGANRKAQFEKYRLKNGEPKIVIMSYQSIVTDIEDEEGPLTNINFGRIIYDECHYIKNNLTVTFAAVQRIRSPKKIFMSGTPIMNRIEETYPYLKLLNYTGIDNVPRFTRQHFHRQFIARREGYITMQNLLRTVAIRRTKDLLNLPTKTFHNDFITFDAAEAEFYAALKFYSKIRVRKLMRTINNIRSRWIPWGEQNALTMIVLQTLLSLIFHLRIACCDPHLVMDKIPRLKGMTIAESAVEMRTPHATTDCPVCYNAACDTTCNDCGCRACWDCWQKLSKLNTMRCLSCLGEVNAESLVRDEVIEDLEKERRHHDYRLLYRSCKTKRVLELVKTELEAGNKIIVVSQWTTYLDILQRQFMYEHPDVPFIILNGKTAPAKRQVSIDNFQADPQIRVAFASLGSSAEGVTLTASCSMVIADVFWNMAKMEQISDRIHRIGQCKPVNVWMLYIKDSIEIKVKELVEKKDAICKVITECRPMKGNVENLIYRVIRFTE